jgi:hypothetical protein
MATAVSADIVFAQKATAIVKAAGLDPKAIDLETFRIWAPIIFCRAYSAIYKESLLSELGEYSSQDDKMLNSQLVIDGLTTKTRNTALATISGIDVCAGNHRAIGILVGILFAEGQRLWLEKVKQHQLQQPQQQPAQPIDAQPQRNQQSNSPQGSPQGDDLREQLKQLYRTQQGGQKSPRELEKLVNRISFLEDRLHRRKGQQTHKPRRSNSRSRSRSKGRPVSSPGRPPRSGVDDQELFDDDNDSANDDISASASARDDYERRVQSRLHSLTKEGLEEHDNGFRRHHKEAARPRKIRPSSAPSGVRRVRHVSSRLYPAQAIHNKVKDELEQKQQPQPRPPPTDRGDRDDPSVQFTYDLRTGRKILLSVAQLQAEERRRQAMIMGQVRDLTTAEDTLMGSPTNAEQRRDKDFTSKEGV